MMNVYMGADVEDFIFGESTTYGYDEVDNVTDEEMNAEGVIECVDDPDVACYRIALENEQNYNAIMTAMMTREIDVLEATGTAMVYEAGKVKEFFGWVKKQIQKFWAKVKGVFKKVMDSLASFVLSNKAFVKKYRPVASQMTTPRKKADFAGYNFPSDLSANYNGVAMSIKNMSVKDIVDGSGNMNDIKTTKLNQCRVTLGGNGTTADNWDEKMKIKFFGSTAQVKNLSVPSFSELLNRLETAAESKKDAKDAYKEAEKSIKTFLGTVKEYESKLDTDEGKGNAEKRARKLSEIINSCLSIMSSTLSYQTRAIVAKAQQDRKMANWYVRGQKMEGFKEFTDLGVNLI